LGHFLFLFLFFFGSILFFWFISVTENVKERDSLQLSHFTQKGKRPAIHFLILTEKSGFMVANINFGDKGIGGQQDNGSPKKIFGALVGFFKIILFNNIF